MKTQSLETTLIRVYRQDHFPLSKLYSDELVENIAEAFGFERVTTDLDNDDEGESRGGLQFHRGFVSPDQPTPNRPIRKLLLEDRRLEITVADTGGHDTASNFLNQLNDYLTPFLADQQSPDWQSQHLVETHQTTWIGQLEIDPFQLINPDLLIVAKQVQQLSKKPQADPILSLQQLSFRLIFDLVDPKMLESSLFLKDREFRLEPRFGVPVNDRAWYSSSPLKSIEHLRLLEELEIKLKR